MANNEDIRALDYSEALPEALEYQPTEWADGAGGGTAITAARLNNIEQGIEALTDRSNDQDEGIKELADAWDSATQLVKIVGISPEYTATASTVTTLNFTATPPEGYMAVGFLRITTGLPNVNVSSFAITSRTKGEGLVGLRNFQSVNQQGTMNIQIVCMRSEFFA